MCIKQLLYAPYQIQKYNTKNRDEGGKNVSNMCTKMSVLVKSHRDHELLCEQDQLTAERKNTMQLRENPLV